MLLGKSLRHLDRIKDTIGCSKDLINLFQTPTSSLWIEEVNDRELPSGQHAVHVCLKIDKPEVTIYPR